MALDLDQLPLTFSNEDNVKAKRGGRGCAIWALGIVCLLIDLFVGFTTKVPISSLRFWVGMCVAPAFGSFLLLPLLKPVQNKKLAVVVDRKGIAKISGKFEIEYGWDQLDRAEMQKRDAHMARTTSYDHFIKLIRKDSPALIQSVGDFDNRLDTIEDEYSVDLNELCVVINQGIKRWGSATQG